MAVNAAGAVIATAELEKGWGVPNNDCANFVSEVFKEAGYPSVFPYSSSVKTIVDSFPASLVSTDIGTAQLADLIIFGDDEHVMIYEGNNTVIGTAGADGQNKVIVCAADVVYTVNHPKPPTISKVLHTGLSGVSGSAPVYATQGVPGGLPGLTGEVAGGAAAAIFGTFSWLPGLALNAGVLIFAAALVWAGLKETLAAADGG